MPIKFTYTQRIALSAAAQREDRCLVPSEKLKGSAARKFTAKLVTLGFAKEIRARTGMPVWRRDEEGGQGHALKLTGAALKAIAAEQVETEPGSMAKATTGVAAAGRTAPAATVTPPDKPQGDMSLEAHIANASNPSAPRAGTKLADVIDLLKRDRGATLAELVAATDWLPHTTRAALTGLRKRGYPVTLDRSDKARGSVYGLATDCAA
jgi:hypothetical protein